jgi:quercetin dioxygenase-like cupin family protein
MNDGGTMIARDLRNIEMFDAWQEEDERLAWRAQFPLMGEPGTESLGSVYFEIEPGKGLASHTDSQDEVVVLLSGSGEGTVGDETSQVNAGGMVFVPAMVPHAFRNTGSETIRALGIFAGAAVVSTFEHVVHPMGIKVFGEQPVTAGSASD